MALLFVQPLCICFTSALHAAAHAELHAPGPKCISFSEYMALHYAACLLLETLADNVAIVKQNATCSSNQFISFRERI